MCREKEVVHEKGLLVKGAIHEKGQLIKAAIHEKGELVKAAIHEKGELVKGVIHEKGLSAKGVLVDSVIMFQLNLLVQVLEVTHFSDRCKCSFCLQEVNGPTGANHIVN